MKKMVTLLVVLFAALHNISAQKEINYINPPAINGEGYSLWLDDIVSNESLCKLRITVQNTKSDVYLVYYLQKSGFEFEKLGKYYEKKIKGVVIDPNTKDAVVVKVTDNDYRHKTFTFYPEGLYAANTNTPSLQLPNMPLKPGGTDKLDKEGALITLSDVSVDKKGLTSVTLEIGLAASAANSLLLIDPSKMAVEAENGQAIESDIKNDKVKALLAGDSKKNKFSYSAGQAVHINWRDALKVMPLVPVEVSSVKIIDQIAPAQPAPKPAPAPAPAPTPAPTPAPQPVVVAAPPQCDPYIGEKNAPVKVTIQSEDGLCFKLHIDGFPVITNFATPAMIYRESGRQKFKFTLMDGTVVEDNSYIADGYSAVGFKLIKKNDGTYTVRYDLGAQVLNEEGERRRDEMMNDVKERSSFNKTTGCFGEATSGATPIRLKVTWKGNPVVGHGVRIRQYGKVIAIGVTDDAGSARLSTNELKGRDVEVEGCAGKFSWSVSGSYCILDSSNNLNLNLDDVARSISRASGRSIDEIGRSWGF